MAKLMCIGRVTADLEQRESSQKEPYIRFSLAENLGYGDKTHTQYFQVWAWGYLAKSLVKRKVRKGSLIWVSGSLELEVFTKSDGKTRDKRLKLKLDDWNYVPVSQSKTERGNPQPESTAPVGTVDGEREGLPEQHSGTSEEALYKRQAMISFFSKSSTAVSGCCLEKGNDAAARDFKQPA